MIKNWKNKKCVNCIFSCRDERIKTRIKIECRKNPPTWNSMNKAFFPTVTNNKACSRFQHEEKE